VSLTPLSDRITRYLQSQTDEDYLACARAFLDADVGLWIPGLSGSSGDRVRADGMPLPRFVAGNGANVLRVCADPDVFAQRYDPRLNALLTGREAVEMLLKLDNSIQGILLASAASEHSLFIPRADAQKLLPPQSWWSRLGLRKQ
jgi:hypothetical protein